MADSQLAGSQLHNPDAIFRRFCENRRAQAWMRSPKTCSLPFSSGPRTGPSSRTAGQSVPIRFLINFAAARHDDTAPISPRRMLFAEFAAIEEAASIVFLVWLGSASCNQAGGKKSITVKVEGDSAVRERKVGANSIALKRLFLDC
jgi:hypothetical protein